MKRLLKWILGLSIVILTVWYFAIKEEHYQVSFTTIQPPGVIYDHISSWDVYAKKDITSIAITSKIPFSEIQQNVQIGDSLFSYRWKISKKGDGKTRVTAYIRDEINGFSQKLSIPFVKNSLIKRSVNNVQNVVNELKFKTQQFKVHSITDTIFSGGYCVYLAIESTMGKKAKNMLSNIATILDYINSNKIAIQGDPFLEVTSWDKMEETIKFNFCFPIEESDSIPQNAQLRFKTLAPIRVLKAEFNGNYSISNNAWYYLLDHADRNNLKIRELPIELYLVDPHVGGDPLNWKAHIFLPLVD
jgi:effector-binding domain-containing protein